MYFLQHINNLQKSLIVAILAVILYALSTVASYSFFSSSTTIKNPIVSQSVSAIPGVESQEDDASVPKTEVCPLSGAMHTKAAKDAWDLRRPLAVMIENHVEARPQSGLSSADIIYEAIAEGGITRFMAIYLCNLSEVQVGPVRSARTYFLDWVLEYDALYVHVGGANTPGKANALGQIIDYKIKDLNQFSIGYPTFWRDYQRLGRPVATEHTMYSTTNKLWEVGNKRGWGVLESDKARWNDTFKSWKFKDDQGGGSNTKVVVNFWEGKSDYSVTWEYDKGCNCYKRKHENAQQVDLNNKKQLSAKNIVVQFMQESHANDGYENNVHLLYQTIGKGKALIFQDGNVIKGQWVKMDRLSREKFLNEKGSEVLFNKGQIWVQTVPEGSEVTF